MNEFQEPGEMQALEKHATKTHLAGYCQGFLADIDRMNGMYRMPEVDKTSRLKMSERLAQFYSILFEECKELDEELDAIQHAYNDPNAIIVHLADLLGDIIVYCASEAKRWDIPIDRVLNTIMQSNFSKLGPDGQPIYDERMKLLKGPNYWKPEPEIEKVLIDWNSRSA